MSEIPSVLLIGNYRPDGQQSMLRFAKALLGLSELGWTVELMQPPVRLGGLCPAGQGVGKWLGYFDKFVLFPRALRRRLRATGRPSLVHVCDHSNAMYVNQLQTTPHLVTCHDVLAIRSALGHFPQNPVRATGRRLQSFILAGLRRARHLACDSGETQRQLLALGGFDPKRATVVTIGLNHPYRPMDLSERRAVFQRQDKLRPLQDRRYLLHVGGNQWYKNRAGVVRIYERYIRQNPPGPDLVLAGSSPQPEVMQTVIAAGLANRVHAVGLVDDVGLNALYSGAECLLFPSHYEGFGWPVLEAMAAGCRVITTNRPPMSEIGGAAAVYLDPNDERGADVRLAGLLAESDDMRRERICAGQRQATAYSTQAMLAGYDSLYRKIAA